MHHINITTTVGFDGVTVADLTSPTYNAAMDRYDFNFTTAVGRFALQQMPEAIGGGNVDLFFQFIDIVEAGVGAVVAQVPLNGSIMPIYTGGAPPPLGDGTRYNIVHPQGWTLYADDQSAGPGELDIYLFEYGNAEWYLFQCCHINTPIPMGPGPA